VNHKYPYRIDPDQVVTYSLRSSNQDSDQYYKIIKIFSDEVVDRGQQVLEIFLKVRGIEPATYIDPERRTNEEIIFTLLMFGILLHVYGTQKLGMYTDGLDSRSHTSASFRINPQAPGWTGFFARAYRILSAPLQLLFRRDSLTTTCQAGSPLDAWLKWLANTGEMSGEVRRLSNVYGIVRHLPPASMEKLLKEIERFASWFEEQSHEVLGKFTPNVESFLKNIQKGGQYRDDMFFCSKQRVEYHLYMVGTELLNRAYRQAFLDTQEKVILLPPCMRLQSSLNCKAERRRTTSRCTGCTPACRIHQISSLGRKLGIDVLILEGDLSTFTQHTVHDVLKHNLGVIGVSCVLTNAPGGLATKDAGIPAQGVLLDYCGCLWHWHDEGIPTDLNLNQLIEILEDEHPSRRSQ
jgi:hypothetical protein